MTRARFLTGAFVVAAATLFAYYAATAAEQQRNPPLCRGLGGGCSPNPAESVGIVAILMVGPALAAMCIIGLFALPRIRNATTRNVVSALLLALAACAGLALVLPTALG